MSLILNKVVGKTIVITEYSVGVQLPEDDERGKSYTIRYIHHNGYTRIEAKFPDKDTFTEWFNLFQSRFYRNKKVSRIGREKKITKWAFDTLEKAYAIYLKEHKS